MSKGLCNIQPESARDEAIRRRLSRNTGGLGFLAAVDAHAKKTGQKFVPVPVVVVAPPDDED